jgi:transposase-like protein
MIELNAQQTFALMRWPHTAGRPVCPWCEAQRPYHLTADRFRCRACMRDFTVRTGTPFAGAKKPLSFYLRALSMFQCGMSTLLAARLLKVDYKSVWNWRQYFRAMKLLINEQGIDGVNIIYELRSLTTKKLVSQSSSFDNALREAAWRGGKFRANGTSAKFFIHEVTRSGWGGMRARSHRFGSKWPTAKRNEYRRDWKSGMKIVEIENKYDCSAPTLIKIQKTFHEHFDPNDDQPMLYMLKEGMTIDEIAEHFQRAPDSLVRRLEYICPAEQAGRLDRAKHEWRETIRARRREEKRARKSEDSANMAIPAIDPSDSAENCLNDLGLPPSALATINKKYARWAGWGSGFLRDRKVLQHE